MDFKVMPLGPIEANCVVLWDDARHAWIVDPGAEAEAVLDFLDANGLTPARVLLTHGHFDHIDGVPGLLARFPDLPVHIGAADVPMVGHPDNAWPPHYARIDAPATLAGDLTEGRELADGGLRARVLATPGHTPGSVCLHFEAANLLLTGDTLFAGSCGRTDFPGGSVAQMKASLARLAALPPELTVVAGHGARTTIAQELRTNPFLA